MKKLAALSLAIALILSLAGCAAQAKTFDIGKASKLVITSGSNGESVEVTDAECIKQITDNFNALKFKDEGKIDRDGWSYLISWLAEDGSCIEKITALGDGSITYGGHYYTVEGSGDKIDLEYIESAFSAAH